MGRELGWKIEATPIDLTRAAAAVVNGDSVALWMDPETGARWPGNSPISESIVTVANLADVQDPKFAAALVVSDRLVSLDTGRPLVTYRPPTLVAGMGCRRGVSEGHLRGLLDDTLRQNGLARQSLAKLATADIKADEAGMIALADALGVPLETYEADRLNAVAERRFDPGDNGGKVSAPTASAARDLLGVFGVSEPAAMLAAGADGVIVPRAKSDRATIAVARIPSPRGSAPEVTAMTDSRFMMPGEALLAAAERAIGAGNLRQGAGLVWQAAMEAMAAAAARYSMPCDNRDEARLFAKHLDTIADPASLPDELSRYRNLLSFGIADSYREHYEGLDGREGTEYEWEPDEYEDHIDTVRDFIEALNGEHVGESA